MGLKYRGWAVALTAGLMISMASAGAVLAGEPAPDDVVMDGVVTVSWVDPDDGPMAGASIQIAFYHEGDESSTSLPAAIMGSDGALVITGVPRPAEGATPLLLDIRGDRSVATVDDAGCTTLEGWQAESKGVPSDLAIDVILASETKSISVNCPEPTPTPDVVDPTPTPEPTATPDVIQPTPAPTATQGGAVLGATGLPQVTPPATDAMNGPVEPSASQFFPVLLALVALAMIVVPTSLAFARTHSRPRRGR